MKYRHAIPHPMGEKYDMLDRIISGMDDDTFMAVVDRMLDRLGPVISFDIIDARAEEAADRACENVYERALDALYIEPRMWYANASRDEYGDYRDPDEHAYEVIIERVQEEFDDDLEKVLEGRPKKAPEFLRAIARAIRDSDSVLFSDNDDLRTYYPAHIEKCIEEGRYSDALDY